MLRSLRFLLRKEFLQIRRDKVILRMLLVMPLVQLVVLGNAATFEVTRARLYVVDHDRTSATRAVVDRLSASGRFVPVATSASGAAADAALLDRDADMIIVLPAGFERDLVRDRRAPVQFILNAEDGSAAGVTQGYALEIVRRYAAERSGAAQPTVEVRRRGWYNPELDYRDYMVPGILVQLLTLIGTLMTALNIVREKEAGTLDQLNVTPVTRSAFIAAKLIPLWAIGLVELAAGLLIARFLFGVPMVGNPAVVFFAGGIYLVAALGIGLWVSTVTETQQQAVFVTFSIMLVYLLMSGLFTPMRAMPEWVQWVARANPMLHFIHLMRGVMMKGAGLADVAPQLAVLATASVVVLTAAVRFHHKRTA